MPAEERSGEGEGIKREKVDAQNPKIIIDEQRKAEG